MNEQYTYSKILEMFFGNRDRALTATQAALGKTRYGQGNLISIRENVNGSFEFVVNATGVAYKDIRKAQSAADQLFLTRVDKLNLTRGATLGDQLGYLSEIMFDVKKNLAKIDMEDQKVLKAAGLSDEVIAELMRGDISSQLVSFRVSEKSREKLADPSQVAEAIRDAMSGRGKRAGKTMQGFTMFDDEGARMLQVSTASGVNLTQSQIAALMSVTGNNFITADKIFGTGQALSSDAVLKNLMKVPKRLRGIMAPRDLSLSGSVLDNILTRAMGSNAGKLTGSDLVERAFLFLDPQFDILANRFGGHSLGGVLDEYYKNVDVAKFIGRHLDEIANKFGGRIAYQFNVILDQSVSEVLAMSQDQIGDRWRSDILKDVMERKLSIIKDANVRKRFQEELIPSIFDSIEKAYDGSSVISQRFMESTRQAIQSEIDNLEDLIRSGSASPEDRVRLRSLKNQLTSTMYATETGTEQYTLRGGINYKGKGYQIKSASMTDRLVDHLEQKGYVGVLTKADLKRDSSMQGKTVGINISGLGETSGIVYSDDISSAFLGRYLGDQNQVEFITRRFQENIDELNDFIQTGRMSKRLVSALEHELTKNIDLLPQSQQDSARRNRLYAQKLLEYYRSGIDPRSAPELLNFVSNYIQSNAFRMTDGNVQVALPGTFRFSTLSEASEMNVDDGYMILGGSGTIPKRGMARYLDPSITNNPKIDFANGVSAKVVQFRLKGHGLLFAAEDVQKYHHVLGGFDLDDKALIQYTTYTNANNMKSFGFLISRQPTGLEEIMFGKAVLDQNLARGIFGNRADIMETMLEMLNSIAIGNTDEATVLLEQITGIKYTEGEASRMGSLIAGLFNFRENRVTGLYEDTGRVSQRSKDILLNATHLGGRLGGQQGTVGEHIENLLANLYQGPELSESAMDILAKGGSMLSVDVIDFKDPKFANFLVQRQALDAAPGDRISPILEAMGEYDSPEFNRIRERLSSITDQDSFDKALGEEYSKAGRSVRKMIHAAVESGIAKQTMLDAEQFGDQLGVYVNRSTLVGNLANQIEEIAANDATLKSILNRDSFRVLLAPSEDVIDASVLMGKVSSAVVDQFGNSVDGSHQQAINAINAIWDSAFNLSKQADDVVKGMGVDARGELLIRQIGRVIGAASSLTDQQLGIDVGLLIRSGAGKARISNSDLRILMDEMRQGAQSILDEFGDSHANGARALETIGKLDRIIGMSSTDLDEDMPQAQRLAFIDEFGLKEGKHASTYTFRKMAEMQKRQMNSMLGMINKIEDASLAYVTSDEKVERIANTLIDDHMERVARIAGVSDNVSDQLLRGIASPAANQELLMNIMYASQKQGVGLEALFNELDRAGFAQGVDILDTVYDLPENDPLKNLVTKMGIFRRKRRAQLQTRLVGDISKLTEVLGRVVQYDSLKSSGKAIGTQEAMDDLSDIFLTSDKESYEYLQYLARNLLRDIYDFEKAGTLSTMGKEPNYSQRARGSYISNLFAGREDDIDLLRAFVGEGKTESAIAQARKLAAEMELQRILIEESEAIDPSMTPEDLAAIDKRVRQMIDDAEEGVLTSVRSSESLSNYKRMNVDRLREIFSDKLVRKAAIGTGLLVAGSFLYESFRDRTPEDMQGPPLLPGGSSYEEYQLRPPSIPDMQMGQAQSSMSYNIRLNGSQKQIEEFTRRAAALTNGNTSTTIYNSLPSMNRDPYSDMGPRF